MMMNTENISEWALKQGQAKFTLFEVLRMLEKGKFERWYKTDFDRYVSGDNGKEATDEIIAGLYDLLKRS